MSGSNTRPRRPTRALVKPRARGLGVPFSGVPGPLNAITDIDGVEVGHSTIISRESAIGRGGRPVRTGVTAVLPRGRAGVTDPVFGAIAVLNGCGELTGSHLVEEFGTIYGPIMLTNTSSVGIVRDAVIEWLKDRWGGPFFAVLPIVGETCDIILNDIHGFHVKKRHAFAALDGASSGRVSEGNVGGGTGMVCYGFKGGIGTASRVCGRDDARFGVGVLVQANYGRRHQLTIAGVPVGAELAEYGIDAPDVGSIIVVIATDAPLLPHQLKRVARRAALGLGRNGSASGNGSGDIFVAFSTENRDSAATHVAGGPRDASGDGVVTRVTALRNDHMDALFEATVQATEEAVVNALIAAESMTGPGGKLIHALPHDQLQQALATYGRLQLRD